MNTNLAQPAKLIRYLLACPCSPRYRRTPLVYKSAGAFKALGLRNRLFCLLFARDILVNGEATYLVLLAKQQEENWAGAPRIPQTGQEHRPCFRAMFNGRLNLIAQALWHQ
ncbi:hypothetical protein BDW71DRAFT_61172 [Aspergillus fruticulosus]